jgi:hypothetical protein
MQLSVDLQRIAMLENLSTNRANELLSLLMENSTMYIQSSFLLEAFLAQMALEVTLGFVDIFVLVQADVGGERAIANIADEWAEIILFSSVFRQVIL